MGLDIIGIGDSLGMVSYGFSNTLPVTVDMMIQHCLPCDAAHRTPSTSSPCPTAAMRTRTWP